MNTIRAEFVIEDGELLVKESTLSSQRKHISIYSEVERLNKHPSIVTNYLKVLAEGKEIKFQIQKPLDNEVKQKKRKSKTSEIGANTNSQGFNERGIRRAEPEEEHGQQQQQRNTCRSRTSSGKTSS